MANKNIDISAISDAIASMLSEYTQDVAEGVKAAVDETAKELLANTKRDAPVLTGRYKKRWR